MHASQTKTPAEAGRLRFWLLGPLPALLVGALLRGFGLAEQVLTGDELHTLNGALSLELGEILRTWTYHGADYCVPLTAFHRFLLDRGVVLTESILRAPVLLFSLASIVVLPALLRPRIGHRPALLLAWLLALSPMLVLYGRIVRSYAPMILLANCAVLAFDRWWRSGSRGAAAATVGLAGLAVYFHLGAAPFVLSPFLFAAARLARSSDLRRERGPGLALLLCAVVAGIALPLLPAMDSLVSLAGVHGRGSLPPLSTWLEVLHLQLGTRSSLLALVLVALVVRGAGVLVRRDAEFAGLLATLVLGQVVGLVILAPNFLEATIVANRYVLILLPLLLAVLAVGIATPFRPGTPRGLEVAAGVALFLPWLGSGPLASPEYGWSSYTHAQPFLNFRQPGDRIPPERVPRFYRELAPGPEAIVEVPWTNVGTHAFNAYQRLHQRPLHVASLNKLHSDPRIRLRNTLPPRAWEIAQSGARYVVVHLDLEEEERWVATSELRHRERLERLPQLWQVLARAGPRIAANLEAAWGPPFYSDASIRVWELPSASPDSR